MRLPEADWQKRQGLGRLTGALGADEGMTRYVGGVVRDTLLGLTISDIDLATSLSPGEALARIQAAGFKAIPTGIAHGTVTAVLPSGPVEVTTLRHDVITDGRHAVVAFTDDWRADAARRDFTINALSADPRTMEVHDYFGGLGDLAARRVCFIGAPLDRIAEDHLRILRFFRFHARFGGATPDAQGLAACIARANDLMTLSRERIAQEMLRLLAGDDPAPTVATMVKCGILKPVLPEIDEKGSAHLAALVRREANLIAGDPLRRLAALLPPDAAIADAVGARLKLSNAQRARLIRAAFPDVDEAPRALAYLLGIESARDRLLLWATDDHAARGLAELANWTSPRLPIGGGELIVLGLQPGPIVADTLRRIEKRWIQEGFPPEERVRELAAEEVARA